VNVLDQVIAGMEVAGRHAVSRVPDLRAYATRWVRRPPREPATITLHELRAALLSAGVEPGRDLLVHASWGGMQKLQAKPSQLVTLLRELSGAAGTLLAPTHAIEKQQGGLFLYDVSRSPTRMGLVSESLRRSPGAVRSPVPHAPVSALGNAAELYTRDYLSESGGTAWGRGSPYWLLGERRGQVLVLGLDFVRTLTLMHCAFDVLGGENPIADFYEPVEYLVTQGGREERVVMRRQRKNLDQNLATFAFRRLALRSGTVRTSDLKGVPITVVDAHAFLEWHLPIARATGLPYWGFSRA
jgi:aminoglycoside N3'-acetyltransferase